MRRSKGKILVETEPDIGTKFTFIFKPAKGDRKAGPDKSQSAHKGEKGKSLWVTSKNPMQEGSPATGNSHKKKRFFDFNRLIPFEKNFIEEKTDPVHALNNKKNREKHYHYYEPFQC